MFNSMLQYTIFTHRYIPIGKHGDKLSELTHECERVVLGPFIPYNELYKYGYKT